MTAKLTIALDAMGGDQAPGMVVRGANIARQRHPNIRFLMFGPEARIARLLDRFRRLRSVTEIRHTDHQVTNDMKAAAALRGGRESSMRLAIDAVDSGEAEGVVSAGNTGALMAMAKFVLKTVPGIDRPAIASLFPTLRGESVMLDLGANIECTAENLVQFAVMGEVFARNTIGVLEPSVGLLNVGAEEQKGREAIREAAQILSSAKLPLRFAGFIEGDDIARGTVDVIVADGFAGNVALKTAEGVAQFYSEALRRTFKSSPLARIGYLLARPALKRFRVRVDPRRYNGAVFLGLNGIAVKSHGGTDALGFANAIGVAADMIQHGFNKRIRDDVKRLTEALQPPSPRAAAI